MGRTDDMIIRQGINVYPREIEQVLETHSSIQEAAAFPLYAKADGEVPVASVTTHDNAVNVQTLIRYCYERLGYKAPVHIEIVDKMPRNSAGKIEKKTLSEWMVAKIGSGPNND